jgi:hypothetical protein
VVVKRLLKRVEQEFGDQVDVLMNTGPTETMYQYNITTCPALVVGNLVKFVGLAPSYESLVGALREAGLE